MTAWCRDTPWRQGDFLPEEAFARFCQSDAGPEGEFAIVISHDCDCACADLSREPFVEVMIGTEIQSLEGHYTNAKSSRVLHLTAEKSGVQQFVSFAPHRRFLILKTELIDYCPSGNWSLSRQNLLILQSWLAYRYRRAAFPNAFNDRLAYEKAINKFEKVIKKSADEVYSILLDLEGLEGTELPDDEVYYLTVYLVYDDSVDGEAPAKVDELARKSFEALQALKVVVDGLDKWIGIQVRAVESISVEAITYGQAIRLLRWDMDSYSLREGREAPS